MNKEIEWKLLGKCKGRVCVAVYERRKCSSWVTVNVDLLCQCLPLEVDVTTKWRQRQRENIPSGFEQVAGASRASTQVWGEESERDLVHFCPNCHCASQRNGQQSCIIRVIQLISPDNNCKKSHSVQNSTLPEQARSLTSNKYKLKCQPFVMSQREWIPSDYFSQVNDNRAMQGCHFQ